MDVPFALVIGESLIDVMLSIDGVDERPGGSPMNVAVGLGRLGRQTQLATWFGRDMRGEALVEHLEASHVQVLPGSDDAPRTSTATVTPRQFGAVAYTFDLSWQMPALPGQLLTVPPAVVHVGSIGATLQPGAGQVLDAVRRLRDRSIISYDPNIRPAVIGDKSVVRPLVEQFVAMADVVKVSWDDLQWLFPDGDMEPAIEWLALGPAIVVVTAGPGGSIGFARNARSVMSPPPNGAMTDDVVLHPQQLDAATVRLPLVDTVGAGDAFMAAMLDGLATMGLLAADRRDDLARIQTDDLTRLLGYATAATGICLSRPGADPPWRSELAPLDLKCPKPSN